MDYKKIASEVISLVGGKDNIVSVQHCATRLRLKLKNFDLRDEDKLSDVEGVKGLFMTNDQFQIIFGSGTVHLVCKEVQEQLGEIVVKEEDTKENKKGVSAIIKLFSDIFVPIIPAIVAGGLLMGINNILTSGMFDGQSIIDLHPAFKDLAAAINLFASAPFTFLPVLIGFSAVKKFGGNPYLGAAMGMIMVHPDLLNAYSLGTGVEVPYWNFFGFEVAAVGYQGTVLPVLASSWILAKLEMYLRKHTPSWLDNLTTPLLSILITSFITFILVGPALRTCGDLIASGITWLYNSLGFVGGGIFGLLYAPITLTGMHHSFIPIETQLLANIESTGGSFIFTTASMNNVAQGAAVLACLALTKNDKLKSICSASGISALLGITEPAMFGVTLKLKYPFYAAIIGSGVGSAWCALNHILAQALGAAGLPGFISMLPKDWMNFGIGLALSMVVSFVLTCVFWKKFDIEPASKEVVLHAVLDGEVKDVKESSDAGFACEAMGKGVCIDPVNHQVVAPADCEVKFVFPSKHALGLDVQGLSVLIHVGIDTVNLNGEGFTSYVSDGQKVKQGDVLLEFDPEVIQKAGYSLQTMCLITDNPDVNIELSTGTKTTKDEVMKVKYAS